MIDQARELRRMAALRQATAASGRREEGKRTRGCCTIAVTSGKGGVGKSNVSLMLSIALARLGKRVLLLDADLGLANIHILLGLTPSGSIRDLLNEQVDPLSLLCTGPGGIRILPGVSGLEQMANLDSLAFSLLVRRLAELERACDYMIVDTSAGISRITTEFCRPADSVLLILTPEPTSLADAYALVKVLRERGGPSVSVLVNMVRTPREGQEIFDKLNALVVQFLKMRLKLLGEVPWEAALPRLIRQQKTLMVEQPQHLVSQRMQACARRICGMSAPESGGFFMRLFQGADRAGR